MSAGLHNSLFLIHDKPPNKFPCLEVSCLIQGNSGTQAPLVMWFCHFLFMISKISMLISIKLVERKDMWRVLWIRPGVTLSSLLSFHWRHQLHSYIWLQWSLAGWPGCLTRQKKKQILINILCHIYESYLKYSLFYEALPIPPQQMSSVIHNI